MYLGFYGVKKISFRQHVSNLVVCRSYMCLFKQKRQLPHTRSYNVLSVCARESFFAWNIFKMYTYHILYSIDIEKEILPNDKKNIVE